MKKHYAWLILLLVGWSTAGWAQTKSIAGRVTSGGDQEGVPGVNVTVKGTTNGTITDANGNYALSVGPEAEVLVFSFIGFAVVEEAINNRAAIDVTLVEDVRQLTEVVVTAVGVERQKRELGYATQEVNNEELTKAANFNAINSLQGKVAGAQISQVGGGVGSSTRITLRGISSLTGGNQPLFVIDGIPVNNQQLRGSVDSRSGTDFGNAGIDINPADIASVNVLKGPAAAALYGSRAAHGAIRITTKSGRGSSKKMEITYNGGVTFEDVLQFPDFQSTYAGGADGVFDPNPFQSWGPRIEGQTVVNKNASFPGQPDSVALRAHPNFYDQILETGITYNNSLSLQGAGERAHYRLSVTSLNQEGTVPNTDFNRFTVQGRGGAQLSNKFSSEMSMTYTKTYSNNLPGVGQSNSNGVFWQGLWEPIDTDFGPSRENFQQPDGTPYVMNADDNPFWNNPFWVLNKNTTTQDRDRLNGFFSINYAPMEGLKFTARAGTDFYSDMRAGRRAFHTLGDVDGFYFEDKYFVTETNVDLIGQYDKQLTQDFSLFLLVGHNTRLNRLERLSATAPALIIPE
ncbi:MAG: TonB-dependent receptor plug domain-containing protein, partial [Catalinimonas sp.]